MKKLIVYLILLGSIFADEEIKLLEEQLLNGYGLPADMMIG